MRRAFLRRSSTSLPGAVILVLFYGRLILYAANWLSDGSEMLLEILNPGIIGGDALPFLLLRQMLFVL